MVPRQLLLIWSEFVQIIGGQSAGGQTVREGEARGRGEGGLYCPGWSYWSRGWLGSGGTRWSLHVGRDQVCFKTLEKWLDRPNMLVGLLCGLLGDIRRGRV